MRVFISWSGPRSQAVAAALAELLPDAIQGLVTWMSQHDIGAGSRWSQELNAELEASQFGIVCLTPENLAAPWLLFEAGSLAKSVSESRVVPYRLNLHSTDVEFPLAQFQGVDATRDGTYQLLLSLNSSREEPLAEDRLRRIFNRWWPDLEARLASIPVSSAVVVQERDDRELLEEILQLVRSGNSRGDASVAVQAEVAKTPAWKYWHTMDQSALESMTLDDLRDVYSHLARRWKESGSLGDEDDIATKMESLREEFAARGAGVPDVFPEPYRVAKGPQAR